MTALAQEEDRTAHGPWPWTMYSKEVHNARARPVHGLQCPLVVDKREGPTRELVRVLEQVAPTAGDLDARAATGIYKAHFVEVPVPLHGGCMAGGLMGQGLALPLGEPAAPAQEEVPGVPGHVVAPGSVREGKEGLAMAGARVAGVVDIDVHVPEELNVPSVPCATQMTEHTTRNQLLVWVFAVTPGYSI